MRCSSGVGQYKELIDNITKINKYKTIDNLIKETIKVNCSELKNENIK